MISDNIYVKYEDQIKLLIESGRRNETYISILLCEQYFNNLFDRVIEYLALILLFTLRINRYKRLTIGKAQIQVSFWISYFSQNGNQKINILRNYENIELNYDVICHFFSHEKTILEERKILVFYTGELRRFHFDLFKSLKEKIAVTNKGYDDRFAIASSIT